MKRKQVFLGSAAGLVALLALSVGPAGGTVRAQERPLRLAFRRLDPANLGIDGTCFLSRGAVLLEGNTSIWGFGVKI